MNNIKIKFDNGGTDVIVSLKGLLGEHKDLTRLKNPRLSLGMKDADGKYLYDGDDVRIKIGDKWEDGIIKFSSTDLCKGTKSTDLLKGCSETFGLASFVVWQPEENTAIMLASFDKKDITKSY